MLPIELQKRLRLVSPDGEIVDDTRFTPCRSFVQAFLINLQASISGSITTTTNTHGGISRIGGISGGWVNRLDINAPSDTSTFGPVVGSGTAPLLNSNFALATLIPHGTGASQLRYFHTVIEPATEIAGAITLLITRLFRNTTVATITVNECGIYSRNTTETGIPTFCIIRDLQIPGMPIPPMHVLALDYRILTRV